MGKSKLILLIAILALARGWLYAQEAPLPGNVTAEGRPVPAASIVLPGKNKSTVADSTGNFSLEKVQLGKVRIRVSAVGFLTLDSSFQFTQNIPVHIALQRQETTNEEVVISGTMRAVTKMASPILVEVYSPAYFKKNPTPNIFEGLQMVNGVQPQLNCNVCNTGDIHINGMEGPYTMVLIDGMPIVSSLSTVYGLSGIPNSMVKRIEIVKGPASTLYGSEAVGGLINIITKDPSATEKLRLDLSATQVGELNADISSSYTFKKINGLLGISYFNYQQKRDINNDNFTDIALQNRFSIFNKWNIAFSKKVNSSLALRYIYEDRWGGELQWKEKFKGGDSVYGESIQTKRVELLSTTSFKANLFFDVSYNYHDQQSYYGDVKYFATQQVAFAQLRWNKQAGNHQLLAGIPLRYTFYDDNTAGTSSLTGANKPESIFLPGIFLQDEIKLQQHLVMLAGIRYDYNSTHGNIFTPRLSFKYAPNNSNTFRFSTGNGYRVVNLFTEDHAALTGAREVVIASALKPEQSWNGNINYSGFLKHHNGFLNFDISAFYTYFTNKIVADYFTDPGKIIYDNLSGYAVSKGITVNADCSFTNGFKLMAGVTLMDVYQVDETADGKNVKTPQLFAPQFSGTFALSYALKKPGIAIDLTGRMNGPMYLPVVPNDFRNEKSPLYTIVNLQVTKTFSNGIELYGGVKNLLHFIPANPLLHPDDPFNKAGGKYFDAAGNPRMDTNPHGYTFDPSYNYAPVQGAKCFAGFRWSFN
jgi:outer membrane receptor for ferrienterochelin and colicins